MKIQLGHSTNTDFQNKLYEPIKNSNFYKNHTFIFPHDGKIVKSEDSLRTIDLFIAEVSDGSIGLGIELGFAHLYKKEIICFYQKGKNISSALKYISKNIIEYNDTDDFIKKLDKIISEIEISIKNSNYNKISKKIEEYNEFFNLDISPKDVYIVYPKTRAEIDQIQGKKTEMRVRGFTNGNTIYILDKENYETESTHKYNEASYTRCLYHELSHVFYRNKTGSYNPRWLNEGLAIYLSGQLIEKRKPIIFKNFLEFDTQGGKEIYNESGFAIELLINNFGKEKLIKLLNSFDEIKNKENLYKKFNEIYGFDISYEVINDLLNK